MTYRYLTDLADVLRAAGLRVVEVPGWKTRGRPASTGGFDPQGNLWHHTGSSEGGRRYADWLATVGRSDLPAPLCHVSVGRDGTVYVCAAGRANHAGKAKASGPCPSGDGNALYVGWECQNTGTEGWTRAQYDAMRVGAAATSSHYGWPAAHNRAHKETSVTGKWDPGALDMDKFRRGIAATMNGSEDDVAAEDVWHFKVKAGGDRYASVLLAQTWQLQQQLVGQVAGLTAAVQALAGGTTDPGAIGAAVEAAVRKALAESTVSVDVNVKGAGA